jgi:hypothetical protein
MNLQDYFREHQMIRMTVVLSIITIGFISAIFGLSMLMQVHGLLTNEGVCTTYQNEELANDMYKDNVKKYGDIDADVMTQKMLKDLFDDKNDAISDKDIEIMCQNIIDENDDFTG